MKKFGILLYPDGQRERFMILVPRIERVRKGNWMAQVLIFRCFVKLKGKDESVGPKLNVGRDKHTGGIIMRLHSPFPGLKLYMCLFFSTLKRALDIFKQRK